jgi:hypothetical protein
MSLGSRVQAAVRSAAAAVVADMQSWISTQLAYLYARLDGRYRTLEAHMAAFDDKVSKLTADVAALRASFGSMKTRVLADLDTLKQQLAVAVAAQGVPQPTLDALDAATQTVEGLTADIDSVDPANPTPVAPADGGTGPAGGPAGPGVAPPTGGDINTPSGPDVAPANPGEVGPTGGPGPA